MKTEARHELTTNWLAKHLAEWNEKLRPHSSAILWALAVVLGLYAALSMWNSRTAGQEQEAWTAYERALMQANYDYGAVQQVADNDEFSGSAAREWASMAWADRQLLMASQMYLLNRDSALNLLNEIAGNYDQISTESASEELRNRARLGLARVSEMRNRLDEARQHYASVEGPLAVVAAARLQALDAKGIDDTTKWLATAELPKPPLPTGPGTPGVRPGLGADLPPIEGAEPFDPTRTMEDFLGGGFGDAAGEGRYKEPGAAGGAAETDAGAGAGAEAAPADAPPAEEGAATDAAPVESPPPTSDSAPATETPAPTTEPPAATETPAAGEPPAQQ